MLLLHLAQFGAGDNRQVGQIELRITAFAGGDENRHFAVERKDATKLSFLLLLLLLLLLHFQWILELETSRKTICRAL